MNNGWVSIFFGGLVHSKWVSPVARQANFDNFCKGLTSSVNSCYDSFPDKIIFIHNYFDNKIFYLSQLPLLNH